MNAKKKVLLLGFGMQGKGALYDLQKFGAFDEITVADSRIDRSAIPFPVDERRVRFVELDASAPGALLEACRGMDVVMTLLPRSFVLEVAEAAAEAGAHFACASYLEEPAEKDPVAAERRRQRIEALDRKCREKGLACLTQFGLDPGLDLFLAGQAIRQLDTVTAFRSYGSGFPEITAATNPLKYKFTWTPSGVMSSYVRPARVIRDGVAVDIPGDQIFNPENIHEMDVPELGGTLECFANGDAVHYAKELGIAGTVTDMGRYVCRWPGHCAFWRVFVQCGFLDETPVDMGECRVVPREFAARLLWNRPEFHYGPQERDVATVLVEAKGTLEGKPSVARYGVVDMRDLETGFTAMTRTVGFVLALGAESIADGTVGKTGVLLPMDLPWDPIVEKLALRGITVTGGAGPA